jgi:hypothetical protein
MFAFKDLEILHKLAFTITVPLFSVAYILYSYTPANSGIQNWELVIRIIVVVVMTTILCYIVDLFIVLLFNYLFVMTNIILPVIAHIFLTIGLLEVPAIILKTEVVPANIFLCLGFLSYGFRIHYWVNLQTKQREEK